MTEDVLTAVEDYQIWLLCGRKRYRAPSWVDGYATKPPGIGSGLVGLSVVAGRAGVEKRKLTCAQADHESDRFPGQVVAGSERVGQLGEVPAWVSWRSARASSARCTSWATAGRPCGSGDVPALSPMHRAEPCAGPSSGTVTSWLLSAMSAASAAGSAVI